MWRFDLATRTWTEVAIATGLGPRLRSTCAHGIVDDVWFVVDPLEEYPSKRPKTTVQCFDLRAKRFSGFMHSLHDLQLQLAHESDSAAAV